MVFASPAKLDIEPGGLVVFHIFIRKKVISEPAVIFPGCWKARR
jgi:hypothetical protein